MSFSSLEKVEFKQSPCGMYAAEATSAEAEFYGYELNSWETFQAHDYYYNLCEDFGADTMLAPVFL